MTTDDDKRDGLYRRRADLLTARNAAITAAERAWDTAVSHLPDMWGGHWADGSEEDDPRPRWGDHPDVRAANTVHDAARRAADDDWRTGNGMVEAMLRELPPREYPIAAPEPFGAEARKRAARAVTTPDPVPEMRASDAVVILARAVAAGVAT